MTSAPRGFTLVESLTVIAIMAVLAGVFMSGLSQYRASQTLMLSSQNVASLLRSARAQAMEGKEGTSWGVHFGTDSVALFSGSSYDANATDTLQVSLGGLEVQSLSLAGGGADVVFQSLTGDTVEQGSVTLTLSSDSSRTRTVSVSAQGVVNVQ